MEDEEPSQQPMIMSNNNGDDENSGTVGAVVDAADTATTILPTSGTTIGNPDPGPASGSNDMNRGGGGSSSISGGRIPMGGRALVGRTGGGRSSSYGRASPARNGSVRPPPMTVHAHSGVPFGHVPAYLPGASSLVEELDQRILLVLRDGKHIIGTLISFDQFGNLVLRNAMDRQIVTVVDDQGRKRNYYADLPLEGLYLGRGESLVLVGAIHDESNNPLMESVTLDELTKLSARAIPALEWDFDTDLTA